MKGMIVIMAGLPGTGKSTLSRALAKAADGVVLNKDLLREAAFSEPFVEYSTGQDDFVQGLMERTATYLLMRRPSLYVFFDGRTFSRSYQIERVIALADKLGTPWRVVECVCAEEVARARIEAASQHPAKNRDFALYQAVRDKFEPIEQPKLVVDTGQPLEENISRALHYLTT
jgi:adenylylsulfate kinase